MRRSANNQRTLQEILDSDDELTTDFAEELFVPAYKDNNRFKYFEELKKKEKESLKDQREEKVQTQQKYVRKAIFSKKDVFCFKCIQGTSSDTHIWFFNFLIYKDMQSNYSFLKSCLVPPYNKYYFRQVVSEPKNKCCNETEVRYKLVIK